MSLLKACQHRVNLRTLSRQVIIHKYNRKLALIYPHAQLQHANFTPPPPPHGHHPPPPPPRGRRPRGPFFRRITRKLIGLGVIIGAFCYFMDADFPTYFYDLYRANYDKLGMTDKTVWVIGASSGIGEYLVYQLVKSGAKRIIISSRRSDQLKRVKQECEQLITKINTANSKITISNELLERMVNEQIEKLADDGQKDLDPSKVEAIRDKIRNELSNKATASNQRDLECEIIIAPLDMLDFLNEGAADQYVQKLMQDLNSRAVPENETGGLYVEPADIDIMVINSGRTQKSLGIQNQQSILLKLQQLNVFAPVALTQAMSRYWRDVVNEGKRSRKSKKLHQIAITSSLAGVLGSPKMSAYSMTKAGINRYMEAMRVELVDDKIDINLICPGPVDLTKDSHPSFSNTDDGTLRDRKEGRIGNDLSLERCAKLYTTALQYSLVESWMSPNPPLLFAYLRQYIPILLGPMGKIIGPKYAKAADKKVVGTNI